MTQSALALARPPRGAPRGQRPRAPSQRNTNCATEMTEGLPTPHHLPRPHRYPQRESARWRPRVDPSPSRLVRLSCTHDHSPETGERLLLRPCRRGKRCGGPGGGSVIPAAWPGSPARSVSAARPSPPLEGEGPAGPGGARSACGPEGRAALGLCRSEPSHSPSPSRSSRVPQGVQLPFGAHSPRQDAGNPNSRPGGGRGGGSGRRAHLLRREGRQG